MRTVRERIRTTAGILVRRPALLAWPAVSQLEWLVQPRTTGRSRPAYPRGVEAERDDPRRAADSGGLTQGCGEAQCLCSDACAIGGAQHQGVGDVHRDSDVALQRGIAHVQDETVE